MKRLYLSSVVLVFLSTSSVFADTQIEFILDESTSMGREIFGKTKSEIAVTSLKKALRSLPQETKVSLRIFGHRHSQRSKDKSCADSELVAEFDSPTSVLSKFSKLKLKPKGYTSLALSLRKAAKDFTDTSKAIVIFSDGLDTCDGDPEAVIKELYDQGIAVRLFIASISSKKKDLEGLSNLAELSGGSFIELESLNQSLGAMRNLGLKAISEFKEQSKRPGDAGTVTDAGDYFLGSLPIESKVYPKNFVGKDDKKDFFKFKASIGERYKVKVGMLKEYANKCSLQLLDEQRREHALSNKMDKGFETDVFTSDNADYVISLTCSLPSTVQYSIDIEKLRDFS